MTVVGEIIYFQLHTRKRERKKDRREKRNKEKERKEEDRIPEKERMKGRKKRRKERTKEERKKESARTYMLQQMQIVPTDRLNLSDMLVCEINDTVITAQHNHCSSGIKRPCCLRL